MTFCLKPESGEDFLEISAIAVRTGAYDAGDTQLQATVKCGTFSGSTETEVRAGDLAAFARELDALNGSLRGAAVLRSMSPRELEIEVYSVNSRGQLAVRGFLGRDVLRVEGAPHAHSVHFGFDLSHDALDSVLNEPWIARALAV